MRCLFRQNSQCTLINGYCKHTEKVVKKVLTKYLALQRLVQFGATVFVFGSTSRILHVL
jgi:hypothetical protein